MKGIKHIVYLGLALGMLIYAIPRLEVGQGLTMPTIFSIVWIAMVLVVIAAQLHFILGVDEEARKELARIRRAKYVYRERRLERGV